MLVEGISLASRSSLLSEPMLPTPASVGVLNLSEVDRALSRPPPARVFSKKIVTRCHTFGKAWHCAMTPPELPTYTVVARSTQTRTSWRPLVQLVCGTAARMALFMTARLLAHRDALAVDGNGVIVPQGLADLDGPRHGVPRNPGSAAVCGVFFAVSLGLSLMSAVQFAADTRQICVIRARLALAMGLSGCALTTVGVWMGEYYRAKMMRPDMYATLAPTMLGLALLVMRLPHSFVASELVHGNTPVKCRSHLGTLLLPAGLMGMSCGFFLRGDMRVPDWASDLLFSSSVSCLVLAVALPRTELSRFRAEE